HSSDDLDVSAGRDFGEHLFRVDPCGVGREGRVAEHHTQWLPRRQWGGQGRSDVFRKAGEQYVAVNVEHFSTLDLLPSNGKAQLETSVEHDLEQKVFTVAPGLHVIDQPGELALSARSGRPARVCHVRGVDSEGSESEIDAECALAPVFLDFFRGSAKSFSGYLRQ